MTTTWQMSWPDDDIPRREPEPVIEVDLPHWELSDVGMSVEGQRVTLDFDCDQSGALIGGQHGPIRKGTRANMVMVGECLSCGYTVVRPVPKRLFNATRYAWARWMYVIEEEP